VSQAQLHPPGDPLPALLWADTSFLFAVCKTLDPGHEVAWSLYDQIQTEDVAVLICRPLLQIEFYAAMRRTVHTLRARDVERLIIDTERRVGPQQTLRLRTMDRKDRAAVRRYALEFGERLLDMALETMQVGSVRLGAKHVRRSRRWVESCDLKSLDALHVELLRSTATQAEIEPGMATLDRDFAKVPDLHIWGLDVDLPQGTAG
jgi:predicted nucleic acid-binding protein